MESIDKAIHGMGSARLAKLHTLSIGVGPYPFQDNAATIYTIANTGAMLLFGQERSRESAALAAEPRCASDSNWAQPFLGHRDLWQSL